MTEKEYKKAVAEYRKNDKLYPDHGFSFRPWEQDLVKQIHDCIDAGLERGAAWAKEASYQWNHDEYKLSEKVR